MVTKSTYYHHALLSERYRSLHQTRFVAVCGNNWPLVLRLCVVEVWSLPVAANETRVSFIGGFVELETPTDELNQ